MQATLLLSLTLTGALACSSTAGPATSPSTAGTGGGGNAGATSSGGSADMGGGGNSAQVGGSATAGTASVGGGGAANGGSGGTAGAAAGNAAGGGGGGGAEPVYPPIEECTNAPSVDRLTQWTASGEGTTVPATGSILVKDGAEYAGKVQFVGAEWHVIPVLIANKFGTAVDLTKATAFTLTYSATADLHVQLRTKSHWSGGDQYATDIPSTGGVVQTKTFSFAEAGWKSLFGAPALSYADTLKEGMGLVFVGNSENTVVFSGLRIDGYTPPCQ